MKEINVNIKLNRLRLFIADIRWSYGIKEWGKKLRLIDMRTPTNENTEAIELKISNFPKLTRGFTDVGIFFRIIMTILRKKTLLF